MCNVGASPTSQISSPALAHLISAKRVLCYLKGPREYAISYPKHTGAVEVGRVDDTCVLSHGRQDEERRETSV
jgi:hypothetical protein